MSTSRAVAAVTTAVLMTAAVPGVALAMNLAVPAAYVGQDLVVPVAGPGCRWVKVNPNCPGDTCAMKWACPYDVYRPRAAKPGHSAPPWTTKPHSWPRYRE